MRPMILKQDDQLPDAYGLDIFFIDGKHESFEIASHKINGHMLEFVTHSDDLWNVVFTSNVKRILFDKRFSKIVSLREKNTNATN